MISRRIATTLAAALLAYAAPTLAQATPPFTITPVPISTRPGR